MLLDVLQKGLLVVVKKIQCCDKQLWNLFWETGVVCRKTQGELVAEFNFHLVSDNVSRSIEKKTCGVGVIGKGIDSSEVILKSLFEKGSYVS